MSWSDMACRLDVTHGRGGLVLAQVDEQAGGSER